MLNTKRNLKKNLNLFISNRILAYFSTKAKIILTSPKSLGADQQDSSETWKITELRLFSNKAERLPVTDMYVRDVRGVDQSLRIILSELCFE
ncbi:hypothetical protein EVAR_95233_1 [Eumeta japonica]|uniref:Uncharacterized protein n=1 Tax=Eumeta variegata TaxID=151549 RepID=A0A4C1UL84_EUMVA|nr:hypothetical protein EVAR_95233_1 [Eumeta japonica]